MRTRALTLEEILAKGIVLTSRDYLGFEFTIGLSQSSGAVNFTLPVIFDRNGVPVPLPIDGPGGVDRTTIDLPGGGGTIRPLLLQMPENINLPDGPKVDVTLPGGQPVRIPAVLVIPGNVGYLRQFFSAQLFVANGAPLGSGLSLRDVNASIHLPPGADTVPNTGDDPLSLPQIVRNGQTITQPSTMPVRALGPDGVAGTADDVPRLNPLDQGQAEFLLRGEQEGFHNLDFRLNAVLDGLPVGPVTLTGRAAGGVLVRNPYFHLTFTVPAVTRRGEPFQVFATVTNVGQGLANDVGVTLDNSLLSGATLNGEQTLRIDTLRAGDSRTLAFNFLAQRTGQVSASYLHFEPGSGASGDLRFSVGVGERGVALSPDTLVMPTSIAQLPPDVVDAAIRVLGQAWSVANAPDGTLPAGVLRIAKSVATRKAMALAEAGLRVTLGAAVSDAVRDLALDFYGGSPQRDAAFDQLLRQTEAGHNFARRVGAALGAAATGAGGALNYEGRVADVASSGPNFISFALDGGGGGGPPPDVTIADATGQLTLPETVSGAIPPSNVSGAVLLPLGAPGAAPTLGLVTSPAAAPYTIALSARQAGPYSLSVTLPTATGSFVRGAVSGTLNAGARARLLVTGAPGTALALQQDANGDGTYETSVPVTLAPLNPSGPQLVAAAVIGPNTLENATPFGLQAGLLFDRLVNANAASDVRHFTIPNNSFQNTRRQLSGRLVFGSLNRPEGPYVPTTMTVAGLTDPRGVVGASSTVPLQSLLTDPGAVVRGRVFNADGTPVSSGVVTYENNPYWTCPLDLDASLAIQGIAATPIGGDGRYEYRYVRQDTCGLPWRMSTSDPLSGARRAVSGYVRTAGEQIVLDIALIGRGSVTGTIRTLTGTPVPGARVAALSDADPQEGGSGVTDATGRYFITGLPVGQLTVQAARETSAGRSSGRLDRAGTTATIDVTLDGDALSVAGRVLEDDGESVSPLPGVPVYFRLATSGVLGMARTGIDGSYIFSGMPIGNFVISAAFGTEHRAEIQGTGAAGDRLLGRDLVINTSPAGGGPGVGTIRGTVRYPAGSPAAGAIVTTGGSGVVSGADGTFELTDVPVRPGVNQTVQAQTPDGRRTGSAVVQVNQSGQVVQGVSIALSGVGSVIFTVLDPAGRPLVGQTVGLTSFCNAACGCSPLVTGADGTVRYDGLPLGSISAKAVRPGVGFTDVAQASAAIARDGDVGRGTLQFLGAGLVSGIVRDPDGNLAFGANVDLQSRVFNAQACDLVTDTAQSVQTGPDGAFHFAGVGVGPVSVSASQTFFPTPASASGVLTRAGQELTFQLTLNNGTSTISGELSGIVYLPDGTTPAGAGVDVTMDGALPQVAVKTTETGRFTFARIFPEGRYTLTVRDARTGGLSQESIVLRAGVDMTHDVRLRGTGSVRVRVNDAAGQPVPNAFVRLRETMFPGRLFEASIDPSNLGVATFAGVYEGPVSAEVSDVFARGGRGATTLPNAGATVDLTVTLNTTGRVTGHFYMPDGTTPIPYGQIALQAGGRTIGQTTALGTGDVGAFSFDYVPAGPVQVTGFDPASGRTAIAGGSIQSEGQLLTLNLVAQSLGTVTGIVTSNGTPQPGANVTIVAGSLRAITMTDALGQYRITGVPAGRVVVTASIGAAFLAGTAAGNLQDEGSELALNVALQASGGLTGQVVAVDGVTAPPTSVVLIQVGGAGGSTFSTTTDVNGRFAFDRLPAGLVTVTVDVLGSPDRARTTAEVPAGGVVEVALRLTGIGSVTGLAQDAAGQPVAGDVSIATNGVIPFRATIRTAADGAFAFAQVPAGPFTLSLVVATGNVLQHGTASGTVAANQSANVNVQLQPSGTVQGVVRRSDGASPAFGSLVTIQLDGDRGSITVYTDNDGRFVQPGVPLGPFLVRIRDQFTAGVGLIDGRRLDTNQQVVDLGTVALDDTEPVVVSTDPADGATSVPTGAAIVVRFSDPLASASGIVVRDGGTVVPSTATLSTDRLSVTLTGSWPVGRTLTMAATTAVTDVYGRHPAQTATTTFHVAAASLVSISVAPTSVTLVGAAQTQQLTVTGTYSDGSRRVLTSGVSFASSDGAVATVGPTGLLTAIAPGQTTITVTAPLVPVVTVGVIVQLPARLSIVKSHVGTFVRGLQGQYTVVVRNAVDAGPSLGPVTVTDLLPQGMALVSMFGSGWQCAAASCSRTDPLAQGSGYPPLTVTVNVSEDAASALTNVVTVSGGGAAVASASDLTAIGQRGQVTGRVTDAQTTAGVAGVGIRFYNVDEDLVAEVVADASGAYAISNLPPGTYYARTVNTLGYVDALYASRACAPCGVSTGTPIVVDPATAAPVVADFALSRGGGVTGRISDRADGHGLSGVAVRIYAYSGLLAAETVTNSTGGYAASGLLPGQYFVGTANTLGYVDGLFAAVDCVPCEVVSGEPVEVAAGGVTGGIDLGLALGGAVSGRVTDALTGAGIVGLAISIVDSHDTLVATATTDTSGRYSWSGLAPGTYRLWPQNTFGYAYPPAPGQAVVVAGEQTFDVDLALGGHGRISGRVTDTSTGAPVSNVRVYVFPASGSAAARVTTGADGFYGFAGLATGTYYVRTGNDVGYVDGLYGGLSCANCPVSSGTPINVTEGTVTSQIDLSLPRGGRIVGRVMDSATGVGLDARTVAVYDSTGAFAASTTTDSRGRYAASGFPAGTYYARTFGAKPFLDGLYGGVICTNCVVTSGAPIQAATGESTANTDFSLALGGRVSGHITDAVTGAVVPGTSVQVTSSSGSFGASARTTATGRYTISGIPSGTYFARTSNSLGYFDGLYAGQICLNCNVTTGTPIPVNAPATSGNIDFALTMSGRIRGRVVDAQTGAGLANMFVTVYSSAGVSVAGVATDATGAYVVSGLVTGNYYAATGGSGYINAVYFGQTCAPCTITSGTPIPVTSGSLTDSIDFSLVRGGEIVGRVTDAQTGVGVPFAQVQIYSSAGSLVTFASTDPTGAYSVTGLPTGTYFAKTVNFSGYLEGLYSGLPCVNCVATTGTPIPVTAGATTPNVNFALPLGGRITGRVTDSQTGAGLANISVQVYSSTGSFLRSATTDTTGAYSVTTLATGTYFARTTNTSGYVDGLYSGFTCVSCSVTSGTAITVSAGNTVTNVNFSLLLGGRISGRVTDSTSGASLANVSVQVRSSTGAFVSSATTNASGDYTVSGLVAGSYFAQTTNSLGYVNGLYSGLTCAPCTVTTGTPISVSNGVTTPNVDFALLPGGRISGQVTESALGAALANVTVQVFSAAGAFVTSANSNASGVYTISGLLPGTYYARTTNSLGYVNGLYLGQQCLNCVATTGTPIQVTAGGTTPNISFALALGGRISGQVADATTGATVAGVTVQVYSSAGTFVSSASTSASGAYSVTGLPPGSYFARTSNSLGYIDGLYLNGTCVGCAVTDGTPISVSAGGTASNINFSLVQGGRISGRVSASDTGVGLQNVAVQIYSSSGAFVTSTSTNAAGTYAVSGLLTGVYFARTRNSLGYIDGVFAGQACVNCDVTSGTPISVTAGATAGNVNFALALGGRVSGRVTDLATGAGLSGVSVSIASNTGGFVASAATDGSGVFTVAGLETGTYFAQTINSLGYFEGLYSGQTCTRCDVTTGTPINVTAGLTVVNVNFALVRGAQIVGRVLDAQSGAGLSNLHVLMYSSTGSFVTSTVPNAAGVFGSSGLAAGTYYASTSNIIGYIDGLYLGRTCSLCDVTSGTPIVLTETATATGVDFSLVRGGQIAGRVTDAQTGLGLAGISVAVYSGSGTLVSVTSTGVGGQFTTAGLVGGTFYARTLNAPGHVDGLYSGQTCVSCDVTRGTPISVTIGSTSSGVDFALQPAAQKIGMKDESVTETDTVAKRGMPGFGGAQADASELNTEPRGRAHVSHLTASSARAQASASPALLRAAAGGAGKASHTSALAVSVESTEQRSGAASQSVLGQVRPTE